MGEKKKYYSVIYFKVSKKYGSRTTFPRRQREEAPVNQMERTRYVTALTCYKLHIKGVNK